MIRILYFFLFFVITSYAKAWDGYDYDRNRYIEIDVGTLVKEGETIDFYEYGRGYASMDIDSIERCGNHVEITGTDNENGEERTFEMD